VNPIDGPPATIATINDYYRARGLSKQGANHARRLQTQLLFPEYIGAQQGPKPQHGDEVLTVQIGVGVKADYSHMLAAFGKASYQEVVRTL
jgi:hypothetical protein